MRKRLLPAIFAVMLALGTAAPASANKNRAPIEATCEGQPVTVMVNFQANGNAAAHVVGGGSFKTTELHLFLHETGEEVFSETTNFPKPATVTCTGTFFSTELEALLDFTVSGVVRPSR
jgi:hypothetical protein